MRQKSVLDIVVEIRLDLNLLNLFVGLNSCWWRDHQMFFFCLVMHVCLQFVCASLSLSYLLVHMWQEHGLREKKSFTVDLFWNWQMIIWTFRIQKLKIGSLADFEKKSFSSLFLMRKPLSSDQKWFPRTYLPLKGGLFVLKSGLRFSFQAVGGAVYGIEEKPLFQLKKWLFRTFRMGTSNGQNKNVRPLFWQLILLFFLEKT